MEGKPIGWRWWVRAIGFSLLAGMFVVLLGLTSWCTMAGMR